MMDAFTPLSQDWFTAAFAQPTRVQQEAWPAIARGEHTLMVAPTGSGKTLAGFFWSIDRLSRLPVDAPAGVRVLYISPLKALAYDVQKNLRSPLDGLLRMAEQRGDTLRQITQASRTGDTTQKQRRSIAKHPPDILITTPESLYLMLTSQVREALRSVHTVIIDEIHTMAGTKRGAHLALSLERLSRLADEEPQRIGMSATQRPLSVVAKYLGGDRKVQIIDTSEDPNLDLQVVVPMTDMERPWATGLPADLLPLPELDPELVLAEDRDAQDDRSIWPAIQPHLLELIQKHHTTIVFTNSRVLCEKLAQRLNLMAREELVLAHHGSVAHDRRTMIEERLKEGSLKGIVATSSLELGIDMGAVDLVIQIASPGSVARGLQRAGRAGHGVGQRSVARIFPKHRGDLLEAAAVAQHMLRGDIEHTRVPRNPLDVLCQQLVAIVSQADWQVDELHTLVRRAAPFSDLSAALFFACLDMLSGRYPSDDFAELRPRLSWDRDTDMLSARRGARMLAVLNAGTIPDRGSYAVYIHPDGPRIGELDEEMVHESRRGHTFILGASTWRIQEITRDRVNVTPAPGEQARMPFWRGQGPGRPAELGRALGAFARELGDQPPETAVSWLQEQAPLDELAAKNLVAYVQEQKSITGEIPSDRRIVIERFRDELGDWRISILSPFGSRVHAPWALAIEAALGLESGFEVQAMSSDDGVSLRFADSDELPPDGVLLPDPEELEELLLRQLDRSALFATRFRENAARALLLPRKRPGKRTPLWAQRLRAQSLMAAVLQYPGFPILLETTRECLQDVFDVPGLKSLLRDIQSRKVQVLHVETQSPSPFARSMNFAWTANFLYDGDAPLAERRAHALTLDPELLRDLLGEDELRKLLDPAAVKQVQAELQRLDPERQIHHPEALHDALRALGHLNPQAIAERCEGEQDGVGWTQQLVSQRKALEVRIAGQRQLIAVEDSARYRDALGVVLPPGLAGVWLESPHDPMRDLVQRYGRSHGPFTQTALAAWLGLPPAQLTALLEQLCRDGRLQRGPLIPNADGEAFCDSKIMRQLRRRTLARLRAQIAAVGGASLASFLCHWQGVGSKAHGKTRLLHVVEQLEGLPIAFSELERAVLSCRVHGYQSSLLDELGAMGSVVWIGAGALGTKDGKVRLMTRESVPLLLDPPELPEDLSALHHALLSHLDSRGASFFIELSIAAGKPANDELLQALWDLVWLGLISNDTCAPLRALAVPSRSGGRSRLKRRRGPSLSAGGRWWLVSTLFTELPSPTERAHSRAVMLLERYGVLSKEALSAESWPGGFGSVYPILRAMEESGKLRRGWFVDGLSGAQFSLPGAVDALRATVDKRHPQLLSVLDPANPYGSLLPWPAVSGSGSGSPRRVPGSVILTLGGEPILLLRKGSMLTFTQDGTRLRLGVRTLLSLAHKFFAKSVSIETVNGEPAIGSTWESELRLGGVELDGGRLRLTLL
ncbi:MAG: ATP-dependent Lhr-like helicase [Cognaticolwellia sp.]|jgi:ATP-dependent Lhr-like helicase